MTCGHTPGTDVSDVDTGETTYLEKPYPEPTEEGSCRQGQGYLEMPKPPLTTDTTPSLEEEETPVNIFFFTLLFFASNSVPFDTRLYIHAIQE